MSGDAVTDTKQLLGWKLIGFAAAGFAGAATRKAAEQVYRARVGEPPPDSPSSPAIPLRQALIWATASGLVAEWVRLAIERSAARLQAEARDQNIAARHIPNEGAERIFVLAESDQHTARST